MYRRLLARLLRRRLARDKLPHHVAIIPDGNRRWARRRGLPAVAGHLRGYQVARRTLDLLWSLGVRHVTFYGLSRENCLYRPREELENLHRLLGRAVEELARDKRVESGRTRVFFGGDLSLLPGWLVESMEWINSSTKGNAPYTLAVAVCYSGRWEVEEAARRLCREAGAWEGLRKAMVFGWLPEPDLLIRTGGELRLSGFLLYHVAYTEFYFTRRLWPAFDEAELYRALLSFQRRERRFGR
ncbi:UDP pyrophosphate synthetase [Pyrodictium occultum]|uniref:Tritrans,polycis-undecaprenyl-diphosphate synthase (geranylgeranyl-diphosphate specific) n=1 Tax=Pyrodictium occultum TaxID=2309 RepID=A0A0V8RWI3_PYROC|nr:UDP pyrophosphate synthetase [Pyrodictium occultum]